MTTSIPNQSKAHGAARMTPTQMALNAGSSDVPYNNTSGMKDFRIKTARVMGSNTQRSSNPYMMMKAGEAGG